VTALDARTSNKATSAGRRFVTMASNSQCQQQQQQQWQAIDITRTNGAWKR